MYYNVGFGMRITPAVKNLIFANVAVFLAQILIPQVVNPRIFGLVPFLVVENLFVWQLVTYMFLHGDFWHIFFNMFILWMFGSRLEGAWGSREFVKYYFLTGFAAGVANLLWNFGSPIPTIGASGAIYGLLAAYALFYPDEHILLYFLIPIKAKYFALILGVIEFLSAYSYDGIAHIAHLGGMVAGFFYIRYRYKHWGIGQNFFKNFFKKKDYF
jgi:membrane associated rhomboid family serine protease